METPRNNNPLVEAQRQFIEKSFGQNLDAILKIDNSKLPESIFVGYFLKDIIDGTLSDEKRNQYLEIAGGFNREIDVFNDQTKEVIYTAPSLLNPNAISALIDRGESMDEIYIKMEQVNQIPLLAMKTEFAGLSKAANKLLVDKDKAQAEYYKRWMDLYYRYNPNEKPPETVESLAKQIPVDFEEF